MKIFAPIAAGLGCLLSLNSFSDNANIYSDGLSPGDSESTWVVGAYALSLNNIYKGGDDINVLVPTLEYRGETFFIKDGELGAKGIVNDGERRAHWADSPDSAHAQIGCHCQQSRQPQYNRVQGSKPRL